MRPVAAGTNLEIEMVYGGDMFEGVGPSTGRVAFDTELAVTNRGTTSVAWLDVTAVFEDAAGNEVDRLGIPAEFFPPMAPGDRRLFGNARGVLAHKMWHLELGDVHLAETR
jgi:hypothetical protein